MTHKHGVFDSDTHFIINPITRQIRNEGSRKTTLIQYDHNSERFTFELDRYIEGHDMSLSNKVEVHFMNIDAVTKETHKDVYIADDLQISETDKNKVICSWLVSSKATQLIGTLNFILRFCCLVDGEVTYAWNTAVASIGISQGINAGDTIVDEYSDVLEKWKAELFNAGYINAATMQNDISVLNARMNTFTSLPNGSTTGDAELQDIRVGADGVTYDTAGEAVREQFSNIIGTLQDTRVDYIQTLTEIPGKYVQDTGKIFDNSSYSMSEPIYVQSGYTVSFTARGYKTQVAMISRLNEDKTHSCLVTSVDSTDRLYTYTVNEDMWLVFTWNATASYSLRITANIPNIITALSESISNQGMDCFDKVTNSIKKEDYVSLSLFSKFGVVGDSYASGEVYYNGGFHDIYNISWGQILARKLGTECVNFSKGGISTKGWLNNSKGLSLMLSTAPQDIYYLALGINDANNYGEEYIGSISDIHENYKQNADSFYGNYGRIIGNIKDHAPNAKIIMFTIVPTTDMKARYNDAIIEIATHFGIPYIVQTDDIFFTSEFYTENKVQSHPVAIVYSGMANAFERLIKKCIINNIEYFKDLYMY